MTTSKPTAHAPDKHEHDEPAPPPAPAKPAEDPNRVITSGEEQLARSAEMERMGIRAYMEAHDERKKKAEKL